MTIATDRVDKELVNRPRRMDIKFLESIISASLVVLGDRTRRSIFESKPGKYLFMATVVTVQSWLRKSSTNVFNLNSVSDAIELAIGEALPLTHIITHLEPLEDPLSLDDRDLD